MRINPEFRQRLSAHPAGPALLSTTTKSLSAADIIAAIEALLAELDNLGLQENDRVAIALPASLPTAVVTLALMQFTTCVPINPQASAAEMRQLLAARGCRLVVAGKDSLAWSCAVEMGIGRLELEQADARFRLSTLSGELAPARAGLSPGAVLLHTSGSSADPKPVALSWAQLFASADKLAGSLQLQPVDRVLNMMPMFHVGAIVDLLLAPLFSGGSVVIGDSISARSFFTANQQFQPSWYQGVPTMLREIVHAAQLELRSSELQHFRFLRSVSSALPAQLKTELEQVFACPVVSIYGMTETAGVICSQDPRVSSLPANQVGPCVAGELSIRDAAGEILGPGQLGEIYVRGNNVISSYADGTGKPEDFVGDWLKTGDQGCLNASGELQITGRIKDIINRGGEKIAPLELDLLLLDLPQVQEAAAFSVPHPSLGEEVALAVVLRPGESLSEQAILAFLAERLASYKLPRHIEFLSALPLGRTGKVQRRALSEQYAQGLEECADWEKPDTPDAQALAKMWQRLLRVRRVGLQDDFFDLGGDSLSASEFMAELHDSTGLQLNPAALYQSPTLQGFAAYVSKLPQSRELNLYQQTYVPDTGISPTVFRELRGVMASWPGERQNPNALIVGANLKGRKTPLFWAVQDKQEFIEILAGLGDDQPVYGMRSLHQLACKETADLGLVARHFAYEIQQIVQGREFVLGGYCAGGRLALQIARDLQKRNCGPERLCLLDAYLDAPYTGDVALFLSQSYQRPGKARFLDSTLNLQKLCAGRFVFESIAGRHSNLLRPGKSQLFVQALQACLAQQPERAWSTKDTASQLLYLPAADCRANIELVHGADRFWPGQGSQLKVRVQNLSQTTWRPEHQLYLGLSFRKPGAKARRPLLAYQNLNHPLAPGEWVDFELGFQAPWRLREYCLELDMVQDGIAWFGELGSCAYRMPVRVFPGASLIFRNREGAACIR